MEKVLIGLFSEVNEVETAVERLMKAGVPREAIGVMAHEVTIAPRIGPIQGIGTSGRVGAGMAIGGFAGFTAGVVALAIPGIGPLLAAGPLAAGLMGAGVGAAAGGVIGKLRQLGVSEEEAGNYCEALRRGAIIVSVTTVPGEPALKVEEILGEHRLVNIEESVASWKEAGWKGFEPAADRPAGSPHPAALPFKPESLRFGKFRERRGVRAYVRVS